VKLQLLIPDLLPAQAPDALIDRYRDLSVPALSWLLARGDRKLLPGTDLESTLLQRFGLAPDTGIAAISCRVHAQNPLDLYWLCADPVHLQAQRSELALIDGGILDIEMAEAQSLCDALNQHFAADALQFIAAEPSRWYLALSQAPDMQTTHLSRIAGQTINAHLPRGTEFRRWHQLLNEVQMLLHGHPVNAAREAQGKPAINSLWFWGGGIAQKPNLHDNLDIWANDMLARGLAMAARIPGHALPQDFATWHAAAQDGTHCIVLDTLRRAAWYGDEPAWRAGMMRLEQYWFAPIKHALQQGKLESVQIQIIGTEEGLDVHLTPGMRWRFWRNSKPLKHYASIQTI